MPCDGSNKKDVCCETHILEVRDKSENLLQTCWTNGPMARIEK